MKAIKTAIITALATCSLAASAQQNIGFRTAQVASPVVQADNSVVFNLLAPMAGEVKVAGDWTGSYSEAAMTRDDDGIWSYTTPVLSPELYTYRYIIDGVTVTDPVNPFTKRDVGNNFSIFFIDGEPAADYLVHDVPHGSMTQTWYHSDALGADRRMQIYTPAAYADTTRRFPVLYLLHGSGGDENAWAELGCLPRIMDNLIARGAIEPMIVVMPNGNPSKQAAPGETSENLAYTPRMSNELGGYKAGAFEMAFPEIVGFVDSNFRTIPERDSRAIAGLSMGGFHSLFISANYPKTFGYVGLFSPGIPPGMIDEKYEAYRNLDGKLETLKDLNLYWIAIGRDDFLYDDVARYRSRLDSLGFPYEYRESAGGHTWANWRQYLRQFTPLLFRPRQ